jgi:general secretion pathway protein M
VDALQTWFEQLAARERLLVAAAAALLVVAIIVLGAVRPLTSAAARSAEQIADQEALLQELDELAARLGPQSGAGAQALAGGGQSLVLVVDRTTRSSGLGAFLKRNQPDGEDAIRLRFEDAPFDALVEWMVELETGYGLAATSVNIDAGRATGRVNCNLVLARGAG